MKDNVGRKVGLGVSARPLTGYYSGQEGLVIQIDRAAGNVELEFENGDCEIYFSENIKIV
ncbi:hypothetical protein ACWA2B_10265 [Paenibacillus sp. CMM36]